MAKMTLLEIVQEIMSDMTSDVINSIDDTDESTQVAQIVASTYRSMMSSRNWPHTKRLIQLTASTDNLLPTHMRIEDNVKEMISIYYDKRKSTETRLRYEEVKWLDPDEFLYYVNQRNSDNSDVLVIDDPSGIKILIQNNRAPSYYTSFDDTTIVFDSFDSDVDNTLQTSKTQARAYTFPNFVLDDDHVPDLPEEAFAALVEEAKSRAMYRLNDRTDVTAQAEADSQQRWLSRKAWRIKGGIAYEDYGRKRRRRGGYRQDITFRKENL